MRISTETLCAFSTAILWVCAGCTTGHREPLKADASEEEEYIVTLPKSAMFSDAPVTAQDMCRVETDLIVRRLSKPVSADLSATGFTESLLFVSSLLDISMVAEPEGFELIRDDPAVPLMLREMPLGFALHWLCHLNGLECGFQYGAIIVSSPDRIHEIEAVPLPLNRIAQNEKAWRTQIEQKLRKSVSVNLENIPIRNALRNLCKQTEVSIVLDPRALAGLGNGTITLSLSGVTALKCLDAIVQRAGLAYTLKDMALFVSDPETCRKTSGFPPQER